MRKKTMIVDDVDTCNFILKKMIGSVNPQFDVIDFTDSTKAIKALPDIQPDLIFLDLNMPNVDGWKFLELMEQAGHEAMVFILTSSTSELDRIKSEKYPNVVKFLTKPMDKEELAAVLNFVEMEVVAS